MSLKDNILYVELSTATTAKNVTTHAFYKNHFIRIVWSPKSSQKSSIKTVITKYNKVQCMIRWSIELSVVLNFPKIKDKIFKIRNIQIMKIISLLSFFSRCFSVFLLLAFITLAHAQVIIYVIYLLRPHISSMILSYRLKMSIFLKFWNANIFFGK